ncbi:hypothetical protein O181_056182 [Austropuccinia psidii MF-1]|uniref:Uncharacterized protein n=1 Tax=Austropuccinia psidii MF-1 TaxID=1389203 RepID=A0A9Q3EF74_9BASI|nr:hypothetical protein [Austropuccinia psidii MF-1]
MSPVHLRDLGFQRHQPEYSKGLSRTRRPGRGHIGHSGGWKDIEGDYTHSAIHFPMQQEPQTRGLEGYWLESDQAFQTPGGEGKQDKGESSHYPSYRRPTDPDREYSDSFRDTRSRPNQFSSGFTPLRKKQISGKESTFFKIPGRFQKTRIQGQKQDHLQQKEGRVRPNDPEAVGFGERSTQ